MDSVRVEITHVSAKVSFRRECLVIKPSPIDHRISEKISPRSHTLMNTKNMVSGRTRRPSAKDCRRRSQAALRSSGQLGLTQLPAGSDCPHVPATLARSKTPFVPILIAWSLTNQDTRPCHDTDSGRMKTRIRMRIIVLWPHPDCGWSSPITVFTSSATPTFSAKLVPSRYLQSVPPRSGIS
jgi:hypothetical protein